MTYTLQQAREDGWADDAEDFTRWRNRVSSICQHLVSVHDSDLVGDWTYADAFESGMQPDEAAHLIIQQAEQESGLDLLV